MFCPIYLNVPEILKERVILVHFNIVLKYKKKLIVGIVGEGKFSRQKFRKNITERYVFPDFNRLWPENSYFGSLSTV